MYTSCYESSYPMTNSPLILPEAINQSSLLPMSRSSFTVIPKLFTSLPLKSSHRHRKPRSSSEEVVMSPVRRKSKSTRIKTKKRGASVSDNYKLDPLTPTTPETNTKW